MTLLPATSLLGKQDLTEIQQNEINDGHSAGKSKTGNPIGCPLTIFFEQVENLEPTLERGFI
ncbi:hypothetical protein [Vibrio vulnificus]|uniref:hypothetical protein n=1 Tax=Vibrio vulnificus TaxID=672 RepID=UPI0012D3F90A|nr:hypothetical protein [Vibrio vulnificus]MCU8502150.1 hypothetical protein [Vibrio vulnificus]